MMINLYLRNPKYSHPYVFKLAEGRVSHHLQLEDESGTQVNLVINGANDRQRQLFYELFGVSPHDETQRPELIDQEEPETV